MRAAATATTSFEFLVLLFIRTFARPLAPALAVVITLFYDRLAFLYGY
jgi:hypothetical protein